MNVFHRAIFFLTYANSVLALHVNGMLVISIGTVVCVYCHRKMKGLLTINQSSLRCVCHMPIHLLSLEEVLIELFRPRIMGLRGLQNTWCGVRYVPMCKKMKHEHAL